GSGGGRGGGEGTRGVVYVRGRGVRGGEVGVEFEEGAGEWRGVVGGDGCGGSEERNGIVRVLLELGEPMTPGEIADAIGKPRNSSLRMLLHRMRKAGDITKSIDGRYTMVRL